MPVLRSILRSVGVVRAPMGLTLRGHVVERGGLPIGPGPHQVTINRQTDDRTIASVPLDDNGRFETSPLPEWLRGDRLSVTIVDANGGRHRVTDVRSPEAGDGYVTIVAAADGLVNATSHIDAKVFEAVERGRARSRSAFSAARQAIRRLVPQSTPDWSDARDRAERLRAIPFAEHTLRIAHRDLRRWDRESVLLNPARGIDRSRQRLAHVLLTEAQAAEIGESPTLCTAVIAGGRFRGFERRSRLAERLRQRLLLDDISLPVTDTPTPGDVDDDSDELGIDELAEDVERAVLLRARASIADLTTNEQPAPTTAADLKRLRAIVEELELAHGTANVAAAREVHSLQVAFVHESTVTINPEILQLLAKFAAIKATLKATHRVDLPEPPDPLEDTFPTYLSQVRHVLHANATEAVPGAIRLTYPQLDDRTWSMMSDEGRNVLAAVVARNGEGVG